MGSYSLMRQMFPVDNTGGAYFPTEETLRVTARLDQRLNDAWMLLCWAASEGRFGPFNASDLHLAWVERFGAEKPVPFTMKDMDWALRELVRMGLLVAGSGEAAARR